MKKILLGLGVLALTTSLLWAGNTTYVGSARSDKYHYISCRVVKRITERYLIYFSNEDVAVRSGYMPCRICNPPMGSLTVKEM
jgi:methylphosphotriester-DNA--protein-cysteine methyltransferase